MRDEPMFPVLVLLAPLIFIVFILGFLRRH
jgi:hypothetical protein